MSTVDGQLIVACGEKIIGTVKSTHGLFEFEYSDEWIRDPESFDLSPRLKRITKNYSGNEVKNFLENLLPEEENRIKIADQNKIDVTDIGGLLKIAGRDSAGALQIYSAEEFNTLAYDPSKVKSLSIEELTEGIKKTGTGINFITSIGLKPSLSGAQDKIACRYESLNESVSFPIAGGATTHILKPNKLTNEKSYKSMEKAALNELVSLRLVKEVLSNTPHTSFYESKNRDLFIIERYDRVNVEGKLHRIHQFDFCQYFGLSSVDKYEVSIKGKGLYGVKELYEAVLAESEKPEDADRVLDWVIFNYLIHNTDSHLKNISMIATPTGFKLAPFYDITSVGFFQYEKTYLYDNQFAFDVGGMSKMDEISDIQWKKLAKHLGMGEDYFLVKIQQLSLKIIKALSLVQTKLQEELKENRNKEDVTKIVSYIYNSVIEKTNRCLVNTKFKTSNTHCSNCNKKLPPKWIFSVGPECIRNN